jgi:Na+/proline symporter
MKEMTLVTLGIYFLILVLVGLLSRKWARRPSQYLIADRKAGILRVAASIFALLGGGELITMASLSYSHAYASFWFFGGIALGFFVLAMLGGKIRSYSEVGKYTSLTDYFNDKHGAVAGFLTTITIVIAFGALLMVQFIAGGILLASLVDWPYPLVVFSMAGIILLYLSVGGFEAVLNTDVLQALVMFSFAAIILTTNPQLAVPVSGGQFTAMPLGDGTTLLILGVFVVIASADIWQCIFAARSLKTARWALSLAAVGFLVFGYFLSNLGINARLVDPTINPDNAFFTAIHDILPQHLLPFAVILVFAAIMSTADTEIFVVSSAIVKQFFRNTSSSGSSTDLVSIRNFTKITIAFVTIIGMLLAIYFTDIVLVYFALIK